MALASLSFANQVAPNFTLDAQTKLSDLKGQVVYVDFWASWCKPCRKSFPWMNDMHAKYPHLKVIAINLDEEREMAAKFLAQTPADFQIVYDPQGEIAQDYELVGMPSSYLIDKKGNIRFAHQGFFLSKQAQYEQEIQLLMSEFADDAK